MRHYFRAPVFLFIATLFISGCGSKDLAYYKEPDVRADRLDDLVSAMTGEFFSSDGSLSLRTARIDDFKRALYVEASNARTHEVQYQGVWKFFDVQGELEMQFWKLTDDERFQGAVDDDDLRNGIWMYHIRELDGCRMDITASDETDVSSDSKSNMKETVPVSLMGRSFFIGSKHSSCLIKGSPVYFGISIKQLDSDSTIRWETSTKDGNQVVNFYRKNTLFKVDT